MLKILITDTIVLPKVKKLWSYLSDSLYQKSLYSIMSTVIAPLLELQQKDPMARTVRKELATPNVNVYSGHLGKPWSEIERVLHYDGKPYISETIRIDLLERNHDDPLAWHFGVEKTFELLTHKYY